MSVSSGNIYFEITNVITSYPYFIIEVTDNENILDTFKTANNIVNLLTKHGYSALTVYNDAMTVDSVINAYNFEVKMDKSPVIIVARGSKELVHNFAQTQGFRVIFVNQQVDEYANGRSFKITNSALRKVNLGDKLIASREAGYARRNNWVEEFKESITTQINNGEENIEFLRGDRIVNNDIYRTIREWLDSESLMIDTYNSNSDKFVITPRKY